MPERTRRSVLTVWRDHRPRATSAGGNAPEMATSAAARQHQSPGLGELDQIFVLVSNFARRAISRAQASARRQ